MPRLLQVSEWKAHEGAILSMRVRRSHPRADAVRCGVTLVTRMQCVTTLCVRFIDALWCGWLTRAVD